MFPNITQAISNDCFLLPGSRFLKCAMSASLKEIQKFTSWLQNFSKVLLYGASLIFENEVEMSDFHICPNCGNEFDENDVAEAKLWNEFQDNKSAELKKAKRLARIFSPGMNVFYCFVFAIAANAVKSEKLGMLFIVCMIAVLAIGYYAKKKADQRENKLFQDYKEEHKTAI